MISRGDLEQAIAECQGERNPNANTCIKLAAYYTILREMEPVADTGYSYASRDDTVRIGSGTEFAERVNGRNLEEFFAVMDELMSTLRIVNPPLYGGVMRKFQ